jgi:8-oxo-dGTP pyrophosphatase MutT (NUDIX family)
MTLQPWKKVSSRSIEKNRFVDFKHDQYKGPNDVDIDYYYLDIPDFALIIPVNEEGKIGVVKQYRVLFDDMVYEFPAGKFEEGQTPEEAAQKELQEEIKYRAKSMEFIGKLRTAPARLNDWFHVFVASDLEHAPLQEDPNEQFIREWWTVEELEHEIMANTFAGGSEVAAWHIAKPRVLELIDQQRQAR